MPVKSLEGAVANHRPVRIGWKHRFKQAAIAVVLRENPAPEVLLVRRVTRKGDPWSGDLACPGGVAQPNDPTLLETAKRELLEETGMDASLNARYWGRLSIVPTRTHNRLAPMIVSPFCFGLLGNPGWQLSSELNKRIWLPLDFLADPRNRLVHKWEIGGFSFSVPCYQYEGELLWGLTLIVLDELVAIRQGKKPYILAWMGRLAHSL